MVTSSSAPSNKSKLLKLVKKRIPILTWLPQYTKNDIVADFIAGISVGLTMMPQSLAYAGLAGIPPQYGLYTAFIGSFTYIFFGTVKEVSIGPTSLMAILTLTYTEGLPIECVILASFVAGCVELLMGVMKLGFLIDFISPPVTSGFTTASALTIIAAQMKSFLGIKLVGHGFGDTLRQVFNKISETRIGDVCLGTSCIIFLVLMKNITKIKTTNSKTKKLLWFLSISKNAICVLITSIIGMYLHEYRGGAPFKLAGNVPQGLPSLQFPKLSAVYNNETMGFTDMVQSLRTGTVIIPVVAVLANVAIAKCYTSHIVVDATQEMITLGLCNIFGSFVQAMPSCGAFTRSSVASSSDVRTPLQGLYSASVIILALSLLTPYFYYIPKATLAAILIVAASSLVEYETFIKLWKTNKTDFILCLITFKLGLMFGVEVSVCVGVALNMLLLLKLWTRPNIFTEIRTMEKGNQYIYIKPELGFYYPACDYLNEYIKKMHLKNHSLPIALDCANVLRLDYAAAKTFQGLIDSYNEEKTTLVLLNLSPEVKKSLKLMLDTSAMEICQSSANICDTSFHYISIPQDIINTEAKDSLKSTIVNENR